MSKKPPSIVGPPLEALTSNLSNGQSISGRINSVQPSGYLERHSLGLSESERVILGNCLSGSFVEPLLIRHLADEVEWLGF